MTPLRKRMLQDMQLRNLAPETQRNYLPHLYKMYVRIGCQSGSGSFLWLATTEAATRTKDSPSLRNPSTR